MKNLIFMKLVEMLLAMFSPDLMKRFADMVLDFVENYVAGTASDVDDKLVLPLCEMIRTTFGIEDND